MSDAVGFTRSGSPRESAAVRPLDEAVWQAWRAEGRAREKKGRETRMKALQWSSIVALLAVAALWSHLMSYETLIRCVLTAAAIGMVFETFNRRQYVLGAVFAGLALIYNPLAPVFSISGDWQRALVVVSALPFVTSLAWRDLKKEAHVD